jgi:hypothetical protein
MLSAWTPEHRNAVAIAWSDWARTQSDARAVLLTIAAWSRRLGVLLACRVARESLRYVPEGELRPLRAIETAERWVRGEASAEECGRAAYAAYAEAACRAAAYAAEVAFADAAASAYAAAVAYAAASAYAADTATTDIVFTADMSVDYAAAAAAYAATADTSVWEIARSAELRRLCHVIADAFLTGSIAEWLR